MRMGLALHQWSDIAQFAIAIAAAMALGGALLQILVARATARRDRVYSYFDRFNQSELRRHSSLYRNYWETQSYKQFRKLGRVDQNQMLVIPNLIEEVATLYNRNLLDKDLAAEVLGVYIVGLWGAGTALVYGLRTEFEDDSFCEWERMKDDTPERQRRALRKTTRRQTIRLCIEYWKLSGELPIDLR